MFLRLYCGFYLSAFVVSSAGGLVVVIAGRHHCSLLFCVWNVKIIPSSPVSTAAVGTLLLLREKLDADDDDSSGEALGVALDAAGGMVFMAGSMSEPDEDPDLYIAAFEIATGQV